MPDVTIYTTKTCGYCKMAKHFFGQHNIKYSEKDVTNDPVLAQEMIDRSGQMGVPVIFIGDQMVVGFDQPRIRELLGV